MTWLAAFLIYFMNDNFMFYLFNVKYVFTLLKSRVKLTKFNRPF